MALRNTKSFHVINIGCKVNRVEADTVAAALLAEGWCSEDLEKADLVFVNTCTVTGEADKKCRKAVRKALSNNDHADIIVSGCAAAISPAEFESMDNRVRVVSRKDISSYFSIDEHVGEAIRIGGSFNTRVGIKIQDGCDQSCTYCIVRTARNDLWSLDRIHAKKQITKYFEAGVNEIILSGINIGAYRDGSYGLSDLIRETLFISDNIREENAFGPRIRLSSIEPRDISSGIIELLAQSEGRFCRHLHIPLQSGSTKVLREMNRPYDAESYLNLVECLRKEVPSISLTTDIIVGFPGESDSEFQETLDLAKMCRFSKIHVFPYSLRKGTPAAERTDQIEPERKTERARVLRTLSNELRLEDFKQRIGSREYVLVETNHALTESYHEIAIPKFAANGDLVETVLERSSMLQ